MGSMLRPHSQRHVWKRWRRCMGGQRSIVLSECLLYALVSRHVVHITNTRVVIGVNYLGFDIIGDLSFGAPFGMLETGGFYPRHLLHDDILGTDSICSNISAPCKYSRCTYAKNFSYDLQRSNLTRRGEERGSSKASWKACDCLHPVIKVKGKN